MQTCICHLATRRNIVCFFVFFAFWVFASVQRSPWGAQASLAVVRRANDESLIKSGPRRSDPPDLARVQNKNPIQFSSFMNISCTRSLYYHSLRMSLLRRRAIRGVQSALLTSGHRTKGCQKTLSALIRFFFSSIFFQVYFIISWIFKNMKYFLDLKLAHMYISSSCILNTFRNVSKDLLPPF